VLWLLLTSYNIINNPIMIYTSNHNAAQLLNNTVEWVKRHQEPNKEWVEIYELKDLKLSSAANLIIWCNRQVENVRETNVSILLATYSLLKNGQYLQVVLSQGISQGN
jgi:hypothetical protein